MKTRCILALAALTAAGMLGCSKEQSVSYDSINARPAPEMMSTTDRGSDLATDYAYMRNINQRGFLDDLRRALYIDNPMRLSPYPIIDASGDPR